MVEDVAPCPATSGPRVGEQPLCQSLLPLDLLCHRPLPLELRQKLCQKPLTLEQPLSQELCQNFLPMEQC